MEIGDKVIIRSDLTEETTGISTVNLIDLLGKEAVIFDVIHRINFKSSYFLDIDSIWGFEEDWLIPVSSKNTQDSIETDWREDYYRYRSD